MAGSRYSRNAVMLRRVTPSLMREGGGEERCILEGTHMRTDAMRLILTNGTVVTPDGVIAGGSVVIEGERIVEVTDATYPTSLSGDEQVLDVGGRYIIPGVICLHNDGLEKAFNPRPNTNFPADFALRTYDAQLAAAGITTQFHALSFLTLAAKQRSLDDAITMSHAVRAFTEAGGGTLDHFVCFRCDVRQPGSLDAILTCIEDAPVRLVTINDHVPGQGQYRNVELFLKQMRPYLPPDKQTDADLWEYHNTRIQHKAETEHVVEETYVRLAHEARTRDFILASHDDDSPEKVEIMHRLGCRMAEFPITVEAARRARELGMHVSIGAPNAVRGGSLTGNASATELAQLGLVDILIADYHAPSILYAAWRWARAGIVSLPDAVAMTGANPATVAGLTDRGSLAPGLRADVLVIEEAGDVPVVAAHIVAGAMRHQRFGVGRRVAAPVASA